MRAHTYQPYLTLMLSLALCGMIGPVWAQSYGGHYGHSPGYGSGYSAGYGSQQGYPAYRYRRPRYQSYAPSYGYSRYNSPSDRGYSPNRCNRGIGGAVGGAFGGLLGSKVGKGSGQLAATAAGALLGYAFGQHVATEAYGCY